jgi:hypothetical protein
LTTTEGGVTGLKVAEGKLAFPYFAATGWQERNHILGQPLPPTSRFLSLRINERHLCLDILQTYKDQQLSIMKSFDTVTS